ncbi:MAG: hypothetical protein NVSMB6_07220 [Burkholderiaceae bacterium]
MIEGDVQRGAKIFNTCAACHSFDSSGVHATGPNLYGLVGRNIGKVSGFKFSPALRNAKDKWSPEKLDAFLKNPQEAYPNNRMPFSGLSDAQDRADVIRFIEKGEPPVK